MNVIQSPSLANVPPQERKKGFVKKTTSFPLPSSSAEFAAELSFELSQE